MSFAKCQGWASLQFRRALKRLQLDSNPEENKHSTIWLSLPKWPVWPNGWVFVYELSGSGFETSCSHLNFRFRACFKQGVTWHSGHYRVWIHSETRTWHDKNIQTEHLWICQTPMVKLSLHWSFILRISSVNVTKSAVYCWLVSFTEEFLNFFMTKVSII